MTGRGATWIWVFGDFELHHHKKICMQREERGHRYPAPWRVYDCNRQARFRRTFTLEKPETVTFYFDGEGYVEVRGKRYAPGTPVPLEAGTNEILVPVMNEYGLPAIFADGEAVVTDGTWEATTFDGKWSPVGCWDLSDPCVKPSDFGLPTARQDHVSVIPTESGTVYDFGKETFIKLVLGGLTPGKEVRLCYGESFEEAMDDEFAVISDRLTPTGERHTFPARACRYVRITAETLPREVYGLYEYLPFEIRCRFDCPDEEIKRIYDVAEYTFRLNSRMFYQDGIKRDRWVWSGDAYQSYFFNYYSYFDPGIIKRTILALRGGDPIASHINTIVDYSLYWLASIADYYRFTGDRRFLSQVYERAVGLARYLLQFENAEGLIEGREGLDWTFIDWSDMDKTGALCIMQMLYCRAMEAMTACALAVGDTENEKVYRKKAEFLRAAVKKIYWNREKGAFVTTVHGRTPSEEVRRHANIFAVLFGFADEKMKESILENVLMNEEIPAITTPYFQLYELEALCRLGKTGLVTERMRAYWGGMLREGATTFWEEYDPEKPREEQLGMYGWKFDKSLCHAWGAGPLYLLGRYYAGIEPTSDGYETFTVTPVLGGLPAYDITVPVKDGSVRVCLDGDRAEILSTRAGGTAVVFGKSCPLTAGETLTVNRE